MTDIESSQVVNPTRKGRLVPPLVDSESRLMPTEADLEGKNGTGIVAEPGIEKTTFLRMLKKESLEYIIDMFYENRTVTKHVFINMVKSTMKTFGPKQKEIAERYFESIDLTEYSFTKSAKAKLLSTTS